ncbi:MAG: DUF1566 domain-containing protein [Paludibacteraceae bacterium]|nr:DUF1566 domain-containing protein [Paludibacteraceae bacterium]MBO5345440.1 DUF1566 domain-containing protein [Paludibacteraceae bacterium]
MKKIFYLVALMAISLLFVQCEQQPCTCTPCPCVDNTCTCGGNNDGSGDSNTGNTDPKEEGTGIEAGHAYVDLGLPSGLKWATCNVGATVSTDFGDYFAWGEVEPKKDYSWDTYKYGTEDNLTKYNSSDNKTVLDPEDDAAHVNWGGKWRMPTKEEMEELDENCTFLYTSKIDVNGYSVFGYKVTGPNGNTIFLPAAGYMNEGTFYYAGSDGYYWSSSRYTDSPRYADSMHFNSENANWGFCPDRNYGRSVRPVCQ